MYRKSVSYNRYATVPVYIQFVTHAYMHKILNVQDVLNYTLNNMLMYMYIFGTYSGEDYMATWLRRGQGKLCVQCTERSVYIYKDGIHTIHQLPNLLGSHHSHKYYIYSMSTESLQAISGVLGTIGQG